MRVTGVNKQVLCRTCVNNQEGVCSFGYIEPNVSTRECNYYRHKEDKLNLGTREGESYGNRLPGTWMNQ